MASYMTEREMQEYRNFHDTRQIEANLHKFSAEQKSALVAELEQKTQKARADAAYAREHRPDYARNIVSRTESGLAAMAREASDLERFIATLIRDSH